MEPWARFSTFKVPKIIDRPAAIKNRTIPTLIPLKVWPAIASNVTRFALCFKTPVRRGSSPASSFTRLGIMLPSVSSRKGWNF